MKYITFPTNRIKFFIKTLERFEPEVLIFDTRGFVHFENKEHEASCSFYVEAIVNNDFAVIKEDFVNMLTVALGTVTSLIKERDEAFETLGAIMHPRFAITGDHIVINEHGFFVDNLEEETFVTKKIKFKNIERGSSVAKQLEDIDSGIFYKTNLRYITLSLNMMQQISREISKSKFLYNRENYFQVILQLLNSKDGVSVFMENGKYKHYRRLIIDDIYYKDGDAFLNVKMKLILVRTITAYMRSFDITSTAIMPFGKKVVAEMYNQRGNLIFRLYV